jgi:hypothetical protein
MTERRDQIGLVLRSQCKHAPCQQVNMKKEKLSTDLLTGLMYEIWVENIKYRELTIEDAERLLNKAFDVHGTKTVKQAHNFIKLAAQNDMLRIADKHIKKFVYLKHDGKVIKKCRKFYSDNNPIWKADPHPEQCRALFASWVSQLLLDATDMESHTSRIVKTLSPELEKQQSRYFIESKLFEIVCEFAGVEHGGVMRKYWEAINGE